ncbi:hypothetical protein EKO27_g1911 [Xylaria grammica]|uniref:Cysteine dioxygenase n=1 Tax=Xylaria grammica TaxID=363999 RepID=A0A439DFK6_9PEZI|nr:hypothetical protein EKO27_g1911 [Xylaria grammica]
MSSVAVNAFDRLVDEIKQVLGPSSGLDSKDVDVQDLAHSMERYVSNAEEWARYYWPEPKMAYTRNLVDEGNGKANLLVLVWTPGKASPIHDHGNAHCLMKILRGNLTETRYGYPDDDKEKPMEMTSERVLKDNAVAYMADGLGLHSMSNRSNDFVVSLHLYTPPNVAKNGCNIFDAQTGRRTHTRCGNYSEYGRKLE